MSIEKILQAAPVVPVVVINDLEDAVPLAKALYNGCLLYTSPSPRDS